MFNNNIRQFNFNTSTEPEGTLMPELRSKDADSEGGKSVYTETLSNSPGRSEYSLLARETSDVQINQESINHQEPDLAENQVSLSKHLDCEARDQMNLESEKL